MKQESEKWTSIYTSKNKIFDFQFREIWRYRDLVKMFVVRDFKTMYKQTILGPLWVIIVPIITTLMQVFVFGNIAGLSTDGTPQFLFYLAGNAIWLYFSGCLTSTADSFVSNSAIFGKVYFPRLITPIAIVISQGISFLVQFGIFLLFDLYYCSQGMAEFNSVALLTPALFCLLAALSLGCGIIIASVTTKYRDLRVLFTFGVQLWQYASAIVFPVSIVPTNLYPIVMANPVVPIVEAFRYGFTGHGAFSIPYLCLSAVTTLAILAVGVCLFNRVEKTFMDTI